MRSVEGPGGHLTLDLQQAQRPILAPIAVQVLSVLPLPQAALDDFVAAKLAANPVLAAGPPRRCRWCGERLRSGWCTVCVGRRTLDSEQEPAQTNSVLGELREAGRALVPSGLEAVVNRVVDHLDERGLLDTGVEEIAFELGRPVTDIENVIAALREVGPPGIAARDARSCLAEQARWHVQRGAPLALTSIVPMHLEAVAAGDHAGIAAAAGIPLEIVDEAVVFLRARMRPYPVFAQPAFELSPRTPPDVIVRYVSGRIDAVTVTVLGPRDLGLHLDTEILESEEDPDPNAREWLAGRSAEAAAFLDVLDRRAATLWRVATEVVRIQMRFVCRGPEDHVALSRTQVAAALGLHPSTVSRTVQGKVVRLPDGRVEPFSAFFGQAVPAKALLARILRSGPRHSDADLSLQLAQAGHRVARRTVNKYRRELERAGVT